MSGGKENPARRRAACILPVLIAGAAIWLAGKSPALFRGAAYAAEKATLAQGEDSGQGAPFAMDGGAAKESHPAAASKPVSSPPGSGLRDMYLTLQAKERELDEREKLLKAEAGQLESLRAGLEAKIKTMETLQADLKQLLDRAETLKKKEVKNLIEIYSGMNADKLRAVIETLAAKDPEMALTILNGLDKAMVSKILGKMDADKASELSRRLFK